MQAYKLSLPGHATNLIKNNKNIHAQGTIKAASARSEKNTQKCLRMSGTVSRNTNELAILTKGSRVCKYQTLKKLARIV